MSVDAAIAEQVAAAVNAALAPVLELVERATSDEPRRLTYTVAEAAVALGVSEASVRRWVDGGALPRLPGISKPLIPRAAVEAFVAEAAS